MAKPLFRCTLQHYPCPIHKWEPHRVEKAISFFVLQTRIRKKERLHLDFPQLVVESLAIKLWDFSRWV